MSKNIKENIKWLKKFKFIKIELKIQTIIKQELMKLLQIQILYLK